MAVLRDERLVYPESPAYTVAMLTALITVLLVANAAPGGNQPGKARQTYIFILKDGEELPCFWEEADPLPGGKSHRVEIDTPWLPKNGFKNVYESDVIEGPRKETANERTERIKAAGFTVIGDAYYLTTEVTLVQRARDMAGVREASDVSKDNVPPAVVEEPTVPAAKSPPPEQAPSFAQRWGLKAGVVLVALALMIAVAKLFLLSG